MMAKGGKRLSVVVLAEAKGENGRKVWPARAVGDWRAIGLLIEAIIGVRRGREG